MNHQQSSRLSSPNASALSPSLSLASRNSPLIVYTLFYILPWVAQYSSSYAAAMLFRKSSSTNFPFNLVQFLCSHSPYQSPVNLKIKRSLHSSPRFDFFTKPRFSTLDLSLRYFLSENAVQESLNVVGQMRRSGIVPAIGTLDQLLSLILRSEMFAEAWPMFRDIVTIGPSPSLRTFNELILGFCGKGFIRCALAMIGLMQRYGLFPDACSFRNVFKACFTMGRKKDAFEVFAYMVQNGFCLPDVGSCAFLVVTLCKEGRLEEARELLDRMETEKKRSIVAYSALIYGYAKFGKTESAREVYMEMDSRGVTPNHYTFNALVYGYSKTNCLNEALIIFDELREKGLIPNNHVYNSLIYGFCRIGLMEEALKVENQMMRNGLVPDIFTNTIMIYGYCRVSMLDRAYEKLMEAYNKGMQPDVVTFTIFIHAYCKTFDMGNAMNILNTMRLEGIEPDIRTYTILIHALCRRYSMGQAMRLVDELTSIGLVPNSVTCNTIINGICNDVLDRAIIIIGKLLKIAFVPDTSTVNIILTHFCRQNMPHRALRWERRLRDASFMLDDITSDILRWARHKQVGTVDSTIECDRAILLEFLMHVTYDFLLRNKPQFSEPLISFKKMDCDGATFQLP